MSDSTGATKLNAEAIRDLTGRASTHIMEASVALSAALERAHKDYDHNADRLEQIFGAIRLLNSALTTEHYTWVDYARARGT